MDKLFNLVGLAFRANKVLYGTKAMNSILNKEAKLVLLAEDTAGNTKKKVLDKCAYYQVPVKLITSRDNLSKCLGKPNVVMISVIEEGFAKKIIEA